MKLKLIPFILRAAQHGKSNKDNCLKHILCFDGIFPIKDMFIIFENNYCFHLCQIENDSHKSSDVNAIKSF